jgi:ABC-type transporter Mla MlaB component
MDNTLHPGETAFHLKFGGKMTYEFYRELEDRVIDAMQRYKRLEIDLSEVSEIDLSGIHLIGLLQNVGVIVATSPVVEQASRSLLASLRAAALGRSERVADDIVHDGGYRRSF